MARGFLSTPGYTVSSLTTRPLIGDAPFEEMVEKDHCEPRNAREPSGPTTSQEPNMIVREVMTPDPIMLSHTASTQEAAQHMRDAGVGDILVQQDGRLMGIVTDRDIVVRVVADGKSPELTTVADCCSEELHTLGPEMDALEAVEAMREFAIRRIPVVEQGQVVGIVSIGDLAIERDEHSALADISAEAPNT